MKKSFILLILFFLGSMHSVLPQAGIKISHAESVRQVRDSMWQHFLKPVGCMNDFEHILTKKQTTELNEYLIGFEKYTTVEIAVVTLDTIWVEKEKFDDFAYHIADSWGVGKKGDDNGILIAISQGYRKIRICNGRGIEKMLSDEETQGIIDTWFIPNFKKGNYYGGIFDGVGALEVILKPRLGEPVEDSRINHYYLVATLHPLDIKEGTKIKMNDVQVGYIKDLSVENDVAYGKLYILNTVKIPVGSKFYIKNEGVLGDQSIYVIPATGEKFYSEGDIIDVK